MSLPNDRPIETRSNNSGFLLIAAVFLTACNAVEAAAVDDDAAAIDELVVTAQRRPQSMLAHASNIARLSTADINAVGHQHLHELLTRVSGVWLSRGSGQESLPAIRSPVLTGAGSCGAFLTLEDGIPTRPAGFCNVNQLFEIDTEQAESIEVIRGPGNALYGSNALHGIINVLMPMPGNVAASNLAIEYGANGFARLRGDLPFAADPNWRASFLLARDDGFRDDSGYEQGKAHLKARTEFFQGELIAALSVTDLAQETAGFILGEEAYKDPAVNRSNPNPEAFRDASSQRLYALWRREFEQYTLDVRPFLRHSDMTFLQHFLPGQPLEENGQRSAGIMAMVITENSQRSITSGFDVEWTDAYLKETQDGPADGSAFLEATRPVGKHYDYVVSGLNVAAYVQAEFALTDRLQFSAGLRAEHMRYDYDNRMLDGNTTDSGAICDFGGCLYTRPADRRDDFTDLAPRLALNVALTPHSSLYISAGRGFRAPQMTELYRLQSGQSVADLDSERIDSLELGWRGAQERWSFDTSVFAMQKKNSVLRDTAGYNVGDGRSRHRGIEWRLDAMPGERWRLSLIGTYAKHTYDFDSVAALGETFVSGRDVDTAPRLLGSAELFYTPRDRLQFAVQWSMIGDYYVDAENRFTYPGHELWNARATLRLGDSFTTTLRLNNLLDTEFADRADYAFGNFRYFPGRGREVFVELNYAAGRRR